MVDIEARRAVRSTDSEATTAARKAYLDAEVAKFYRTGQDIVTAIAKNQFNAAPPSFDSTDDTVVPGH